MLGRAWRFLGVAALAAAALGVVPAPAAATGSACQLPKFGPGRRFRQEWYQGHAEDVFKVVDRWAAVTVPYGSFRHALRTAEWTALEPEVLDNKLYVAGIGQVAEVSVKGPREGLRLVEIIS